MPCRHWPPSPPLMPSATCRSERIGIGDHFTSSATGAPAGTSMAAGVPAGERAAKSATIEITTTASNDLVLIGALFTGRWLLWKRWAGICQKFVAKVEKAAKIAV